MSRIRSKFIRFGTGTDETNARLIPANYTPTNYTPDQVASEGTDKISAHLKGINNALNSTPGDISTTAYTNNTDVVTNQNITGFAFANGSIRSFKAQVSVSISATANLYAVYDIQGVQRDADWIITSTYTGDNTPVTFNITTGGQVQYSKTTTSGHTQTKIVFRATVTTV